MITRSHLLLLCTVFVVHQSMNASSDLGSGKKRNKSYSAVAAQATTDASAAIATPAGVVAVTQTDNAEVTNMDSKREKEAEESQSPKTSKKQKPGSGASAAAAVAAAAAGKGGKPEIVVAPSATPEHNVFRHGVQYGLRKKWSHAHEILINDLNALPKGHKAVVSDKIENERLSGAAASHLCANSLEVAKYDGQEITPIEGTNVESYMHLQDLAIERDMEIGKAARQQGRQYLKNHLANQRKCLQRDILNRSAYIARLKAAVHKSYDPALGGNTDDEDSDLESYSTPSKVANDKTNLATATFDKTKKTAKPAAATPTAPAAAPATATAAAAASAATATDKK